MVTIDKKIKNKRHFWENAKWFILRLLNVDFWVKKNDAFGFEHVQSVLEGFHTE